jgi:hypothetical protein
MNAEREMQGDDFPLATITFAAMTRTTSLLPSGDLVRGWLFRRCRGAAGRVIGAMLALASLSTSLGATAWRGGGAHNIDAGHGSCARLLAAAGTKLGEARRPSIDIGCKQNRPATQLDRAQFAGAYLLICRLATDAISVAKFLDSKSAIVHREGLRLRLVAYKGLCPRNRRASAAR